MATWMDDTHTHNNGRSWIFHPTPPRNFVLSCLSWEIRQDKARGYDEGWMRLGVPLAHMGFSG